MHRCQDGQFRFDELYLANSQGPNLRTTATVGQLEEPPDFCQGEPQCLGSLDEEQPFDMVWRIAPLTTQRFDWLFQEALTLVVADCFNPNICHRRQLANTQPLDLPLSNRTPAPR